MQVSQDQSTQGFLLSAVASLIRMVLMDRFRRGVEFGMASFQRCHSLSCQMAESPPIDAQNPAIRCKEKSRRSKCCHPTEVPPVVPEQAMEFLSRTWSPSSLDLFQILAPSSLGSSSEDHEADQAGGDKDEDEDEEKIFDTARTNRERGQLFDQTWGVLASGKPRSAQRMRKLSQPTWLNAGHMKTMLRGFFLDSVPVTGSRRRRRRDEIRLHSAQAHAAVSVAQLAAAVAGVVSVCELRPAAAAADKKLGPVLASAAALVATVCAEAAQTAGANRGRITSALRNGLESRSSAELLTLMATAATCLRGAAALKLRTADLKGISSGSNAMAMSISAGIQKGTALRVCLPCGRVRVRIVSIFPKRGGGGGGGAVALRLGKKRLGGAFATYEDYEVSSVGDGGGEVVVEDRPAFPVVVCAAEGATVQLLFEHQMHCKIWKASIEGMLSEQRLKRANN